MKTFSASVVLALGLALAGCGGGDSGPAQSETPAMTEEQVREAMTSSMPPDALKSMPPQARKMYEQHLRGGRPPGQ